MLSTTNVYADKFFYLQKYTHSKINVVTTTSSFQDQRELEILTCFNNNRRSVARNCSVRINCCYNRCIQSARHQTTKSNSSFSGKLVLSIAQRNLKKLLLHSGFIFTKNYKYAIKILHCFSSLTIKLNRSFFVNPSRQL